MRRSKKKAMRRLEAFARTDAAAYRNAVAKIGGQGIRSDVAIEETRPGAVKPFPIGRSAGVLDATGMIDADAFRIFMQALVPPEWRWPIRQPTWLPGSPPSENELGMMAAHRPPIHEGEIAMDPIVRALRTGPGEEVYPAWVVAGETVPGELRVHRLGASAPGAWVEDFAKDLAPWVKVDRGAARCLLHDDCALDPDLGRACFEAARAASREEAR